MKLTELAKVVRSKNAGPLHVTLDLMFSDRAGFELARQSPSLSPAAIAALYKVDEETVEVIPFGAALAIKIAIDRPIVAGTPGDSDVFGAQQHKPLLEIEI
jgi:hypothetical protein